VKTVLFVGAGRHQRGAIGQARARGLRVAAVDRNSDAPGLASADIAEVVDFMEVAAVVEVARRIGVDGVLTVSADRAVPVVAAVAEELGLPGIGTETAHRLTHKRAMRGALAEAGLPQPAHARLHSPDDIRTALDEVRLPAVLKPVDSGGQRAVFRIESRDELERDLAEAITESPTGEAILEEFVDGVEMNGIVVARNGEPALVTLSDRLRPPGIGFGVGWMHVYPPSVSGDQLRLSEHVAVESVRALGLRDAIAFPQLIASPDGGVAVVEVAARIPGGQMADLVRHAVGIDLVEVALRQALGEDVPDNVALPHFSQPLAIRFFTAQPGPLPTGEVLRVGSLDPVLAADGVVQADTYLQVGETIRPVRRDGDRRGYVIAIADSSDEALLRAERAAELLEVEVAL
jgi:biotin carboxylase